MAAGQERTWGRDGRWRDGAGPGGPGRYRRAEPHLHHLHHLHHTDHGRAQLPFTGLDVLLFMATALVFVSLGLLLRTSSTLIGRARPVLDTPKGY